MSVNDNGLEYDGDDDNRSHPELPPGLPAPPGIDRGEVASYLRNWGDTYAEVGMPLADTSDTVPLDPERAIEQHHDALQQRIGQWSQASRTAMTALREQRQTSVDEATREIDELEEQLAARHEEMERHDTETAALEPGRRFEGALPVAWLVAPFLLSLLEYPVVQPAVGRLLDVTGMAQVLATVAIIVGQVLMYEATGAMAQRWRSAGGTRAEHRTVIGATVAGFSLSMMFIVGLTLVRLDQLPEGEATTAATMLFIGVQAAFALLSMVSGWRATAPEAAARRHLLREIDRLKANRDAVQNHRAAEAQEVDYLDGFLGTWDAWIQNHRISVRAEYVAEIFGFRAHLKIELAKSHGDRPVYRLEQIPQPTFPLSHEDVGLPGATT